MLNKEIIIQRLALIKHLYKIGIEQSRQSDIIATFSILSFHDSVEMFLKLLAEDKGINSDNFKFLQYWDNIENLSLKEPMRGLNNRRVNLKHKGLLPSKLDVETSRVTVDDFFDQNCQIQFGIDFKTISLLNLVSYSTVKSFLIAAQEAININDNKTSIKNTSFAFDELQFAYESNKKDLYRKSPFYFGRRLISWRSDIDALEDLHRGLGRQFKNLFEIVDNLQETVKMTSLGFDFRQYAKFKLLVHEVYRETNGKYRITNYSEAILNCENCQFCVDFVISCALKLQDFDFDINHLIINDD